MTKSAKGTVRLELSYAEAEKMGYWLFDYTLKYEINGAKFKRHFKSHDAANQYASILADNGIYAMLAAKRHKKRASR